MDRWAFSDGERKFSQFERNLAVACLFGLVTLNVAFVAWKVAGVPVRGLMAVGLLGVVYLVYPEHLLGAIRRFAAILWLSAGLALLGIFVSIINANSYDKIVSSVVEIHLQVPITLLVAAVLSEIAGMKNATLAIAAVVVISTIVALFQFLGFESAWGLRDALDSIQSYDSPLEEGFEAGRPMGVALTKIQFSTHACLAFAVYAAMRERTRGLGRRPDYDLLILTALGVLAAASIISATRSPLLGVAAFLPIYMVRRPGSWLIPAAIIGLILVAFSGSMIFDALQSAQPRILRTDDNSATGRGALFSMGVLLFFDNPLGYGLGFNPVEHWQKVWQELYTLQNPSVLMDTQLHNFLLNMLNTYGIGLLLFAPLIYGLLRDSRHVVIFFIPYIVHIMFHNSGPFRNDILIWFTVAALSAPVIQSKVSNLEFAPTIPRFVR